MKNYFFQSSLLFLLLDRLGYDLPNFRRFYDMSDYGISAEDFLNQYDNEALKDVKVCWDKLTVEEKKKVITLMISDIASERNLLENIEKGAIEIDMELNKQGKEIVSDEC